MKHDINSYGCVVKFIQSVDEQLSENLIARMDSDFDRTLEEPDHKLRAKLVKAHNRNVKEVSPISDVINPLQIRMTQIKTNLVFVLENACYNLSYTAAAKYFAEYDFISQMIKKEVKKQANNPVIKDFIERTTVLNENMFEIMTSTLNTMKTNIQTRMNTVPESYIGLDIERDSSLNFDDVKAAYKAQLKKLKEDHKKV